MGHHVINQPVLIPDLQLVKLWLVVPAKARAQLKLTHGHFNPMVRIRTHFSKISWKMSLNLPS